MKTSSNYRRTLERNEKCRGAMFPPRSNSSLYQDIDAEDPLLPNSSSDSFQSGLKKRPSKISVAYTMGPEGNLLEPQPLPIEIRLAPHHPPTIHGETHRKIIFQILIPYLIAGMGMVFAGIYFNMVQGWEVFIEVSEIIVLVPSLLGLKGNLEMTLASRLSTEANLGNMDNKQERFAMITGNLCLVQAQAIVIALLAAWVSVMFSGLVKKLVQLRPCVIDVCEQSCHCFFCEFDFRFDNIFCHRDIEDDQH
uniref:SLC41A/MgtE integral membrane domain-containing protein n=1 Tax=Clastoptera arizonana TaxID=38151 RepID=A0A1B6CM16_9HEMI